RDGPPQPHLLLDPHGARISRTVPVARLRQAEAAGGRVVEGRRRWLRRHPRRLLALAVRLGGVRLAGRRDAPRRRLTPRAPDLGGPADYPRASRHWSSSRTSPRS